VISLFLLSLLALSGFAQQTRIEIPYTRFTLSNGLNVILHEDHTTPTVALNIWYHVGSAREKPGRTGLAHLFEHLMFEGSQHVPERKFDQWLEATGGENNASTAQDRTNYYLTVPRNALELPLFLESDRMGFLLPAMSPATVDGQRDVVKNERRESVENQPYGMSEDILPENLYPPEHPYHWPIIGSMADLSAASYEDVVGFFKTYYSPSNASLCVAGDIDPATTRALVEKWFSDVPGGRPELPLAKPAVTLTTEKRLYYQDNVQLPRLYMVWLSPAAYTPGDAELDLLANVLGRGKNSRLYRRLVYDLQIAQDVFVYQSQGELNSTFGIIVTARSGHGLTEIEKVIQEELNRIKAEAAQRRELERAVNQYESGFLRQIEIVSQKADQLNAYYTMTGNPDYFNEDLARYKAVDPDDIRAIAETYLKDDARLVLSIVPKGRKDLASGDGKEVEGR
jgi:zinc protease